jgi:hypothetical protein
MQISMSLVKHTMDFFTASTLCFGVQRLVDIPNKMKDPSERLGAIPVVGEMFSRGGLNS